MKANAEAAKRRLARLNQEYQIRSRMQKISKVVIKPTKESFAEAVARIAQESQVAI